jgi:uncharacterized protein GlcG (DUF336 family)
MNSFFKASCFGVLSILLSCSAGSGDSTVGTGAGAVECNGSCTDASSFLSVAETETIIAQAVTEAQAQGAAGTIAVVDRVGNVLAVFRMNSAATNVAIDSGRNVSGGLEGINVIPDTLAAISKAMTGAYLSSEGNAFSTRTASQIVQEHFNPGETGQPGGPLFGVQFSNLPCSDLNTRFTTGADAGPHRTPLGLSADPGGLPLYKNGAVVGGIGVIADGIYGLDLNTNDRDRDVDELIAVAGSYGFAAPVDRREKITLDGKVARFSDVDFSDLAATPGNAPSFASIDGSSGSLQAVTGYTAGAAIDGKAFGQPDSGIRADTSNYPGLDAFVLVDDSNVNRFPPIAGSDGANALSASEVKQLISSALAVANHARSQIRRPLGSQARVTVSVVDTNGKILGIARTRDGPLFGTDVSLQKARTATLFSGTHGAAELSAVPNTIYRNPDASPSGVQINIADYVAAVRNFLGAPTALTDGAYAFADRSGGNLSRPFFPDGSVGSVNGPFSKPIASWSPFSDGLQLDLVMNRVIQHVVYVKGGGPDTPQNCTTLSRLANGMQVFPGSVPIYRGNILVGGIGVSGDGVDQDDMVSFLGLNNASEILGTINNAPAAMRADNLAPMGINLRFVQCPQSPFLDSTETDVCHGK